MQYSCRECGKEYSLSLGATRCEMQHIQGRCEHVGKDYIPLFYGEYGDSFSGINLVCHVCNKLLGVACKDIRTLNQEALEKLYEILEGELFLT